MNSSWVSWPGRIRLAAMLMLIILAASPLYSQHSQSEPAAPDATVDHRHDHHHPPSADQWEGSAEGKAYSEFNHHVAGTLVILIGISEIHSAMRPAVFTWTRFMLPAAMTAVGFFLLIWSDHDGWPIGPRGLVETFLAGSFETIQHKWFG